MELSESPAAPADDTSTCSGGHSPVFDSSAGGISSPVEHLGRGPVAQGLMGSQVVVETGSVNGGGMLGHWGGLNCTT